MWLSLMWLKFEVVRGPVGIVWGRFGAGLNGPQNRRPAARPPVTEAARSPTLTNMQQCLRTGLRIGLRD